MSKVILKVIENGNSFPVAGDLVFCNDNNMIYTILNDLDVVAGYSCGHIFTDNPGDGDYCYMVGEFYGESADLDEMEFENYVFPVTVKVVNKYVNS